MGPGQWTGLSIFAALLALALRAVMTAGTNVEDRVSGEWFADHIRNRRG